MEIYDTLDAGERGIAFFIDQLEVSNRGSYMVIVDGGYICEVTIADTYGNMFDPIDPAFVLSAAEAQYLIDLASAAIPAHLGSLADYLTNAADLAWQDRLGDAYIRVDETMQPL